MASPNIDKLSYADLRKLQDRIIAAITTKRAEEAQAAKQRSASWLRSAGSTSTSCSGSGARRALPWPNTATPKI